MVIFAVEDERLALNGLVRSIQRVVPDATVLSFENPLEALEAAKEQRPDVVFSDIQMPGMDGITLAIRMKELHANINFIFTTSYDSYTLDAFSLYASGYLIKPISPAKIQNALSNLRFAAADGAGAPPKKLLQVQCFGNFELFYNNQPVHFKYSKTKEMVAYLVDRRGSMCSFNMLSAAIFEDDSHASYLYKMRTDLLATLKDIGCSDIVNVEYGKIGILPDRIDCDYYRWLSGSGKFTGEYMTQYSWADDTLSTLLAAARN